MGVKEVGRRLVGGVWVTDVRDEDGGGNGGSQPLALIGPIEVAFDAVGDGGSFGAGNPVQVVVLPDDSLLVGAWAFASTPFNGGNDVINLYIADDGDFGTSSTFSGEWLATFTDGTPGKWTQADTAGTVTTGRMVVTEIDAALWAQLTADGAAIAGVAQIYALVYTP